MSTASLLLTIALLWFATAVAPGPNFIATTRIALLHGRVTGMRTAVGIACGTSLWGLAGFFGVHALFTLAPWLHLALKLGGSAYLILLGVKYLASSYRREPIPLARPRAMSTRSAVLFGMVTSLANPQTALSVASLFAATLPPQPSIVLGISAALAMTVVSLAWYSLVACALTVRRAALAFRRVRHWIDRIAGLAFLGFGTRLALER